MSYYHGYGYGGGYRHYGGYGYGYGGGYYRKYDQNFLFISD